MRPNHKLSRTVAAILSASAIRMVLAADTAVTTPAPPAGQAEESSPDVQALQPVVVTATRRSENVQNVPVTVQVLTGQMLQQQHLSSFEDYVRMIPNLTSADNGPGQNEIVIRGIDAGSTSTQDSGITGLWPNVAVYLDNQSVQLPNQNLDVYTVDLSRIEVLEGPQGTLFGGGAEAGAIRYITNTPKLDKVEGNFSGDYGVTAHGDPNTAVTAVLNLPVISRRLAVRLVAYSDRRGGYIDNVPGTFSFHNTDLGIHYANFPAVNGQCPDGQPNGGFCVPPGSPVANNSSLVRNAINPVTYQGARAEALYRFNDDWSLLVTQMNQSLDAEGVFFQYPNAPDGRPLDPLQVVLFTPAFHKDKWSNTSWTLTGKAGDLNVIYTGGFLTRNLETETDYTNYARGFYGDYYHCYGPGSGGNAALQSTCFSPVGAVLDFQQNRHWQHELRAQTPRDWRLHGTFGVYEEDNVIYDQDDYETQTLPSCTSNGAPGTAGNSGCISNLGTFPGTTVMYPGVKNGQISFYVDTKREIRQLAEFVSASFDLTRQLTVTAGARHFVYWNSQVGDIISGFGCFQAGAPAGGCHSAASTNDDAQNLRDTESGWRAEANISWRFAPTLFGHRQHIMPYFTFSQGFRPGGFNSNGGTGHIPGPDGESQFLISRTYHSDSLDNYELGWKTDWVLQNHYLQWNAAVFREDWSNVQINFFDPGLLGLLNINENGQNFRIKGVETSFIAQIWRGLTLRGASAWDSSEQTNSPALIDNNPASVNFGKPITEECGAGPTSCTPVVNPFGPRGDPTADSPPIRFSFLLRYDFPVPDVGGLGYLNGATAHVQVGMQHQGHSFTQAGSNPQFIPGVVVSTQRLRFENPAYTLYDASVGVSQGPWTFSLYGENLANSNAAVFTSTDQFIVAQTPLRPRVIGATFTYAF